MNNLDTTNQQILKYLSEGLTVKQIAANVFLSYEAVNKRLDILKEKTGAKTHAQLVAKYKDFSYQNDNKAA